MHIFFSVLSAAYIAAIFLLADSPVVSDVAPFNPYSLLHIPLYGFLTLFLILAFLPQRKKSVDAANSIDPIDSKDPINPINSTGSTNSIDPTNPIDSSHSINSTDSIDSKDPINSTDSSNSTNSTNSRNLVVPGIIALVVAVADEVHQAYLPNRNASVIDVLLDIIGIILCIALISRVKGKSKLINVMISRKTQKKGI